MFALILLWLIEVLPVFILLHFNCYLLNFLVNKNGLWLFYGLAFLFAAFLGKFASFIVLKCAGAVFVVDIDVKRKNYLIAVFFCLLLIYVFI